MSDKTITGGIMADSEAKREMRTFEVESTLAEQELRTLRLMIAQWVGRIDEKGLVWLIDRKDTKQ